jgi:hypothetical protein
MQAAFAGVDLAAERTRAHAGIDGIPAVLAGHHFLACRHPATMTAKTNYTFASGRKGEAFILKRAIIPY